MWRLTSKACLETARRSTQRSSFLVLAAPKLLFSYLISSSYSATVMTEEVKVNGNSRGLQNKRSDEPVDANDFSIIKEGQADILVRGNDVFYNKAQIVNRDLSIAVLRTFIEKRKEERLAKEEARKAKAKHGDEQNAEEKVEAENNAKKSTEDKEDSKEELKLSNEDKPGNTNPRKPETFTILEALAASGLRAIRYAREVEAIDSIVALDIDPVAVEACQRNIKLNGKVVMSKVRPEQGDAKIYMLNHEKEFDVVDIDPYGSPSIFLDSAVQCVKDGGLLMCTATDMAVLCGNHGEVCFSKYGSYALRGKHCHEAAVRILLSSIESHANRYKRHIVPILSVSIDFYVRVFVRIYTSPINVKEAPSKLSYIFQCVGCDSFHLQPMGRVFKKEKSTRYLPGVGPTVPQKCPECGKHWEMGGPLWSEPIHDPEWVSTIYKSISKSRDRYPAYDKVHALLTAVSEELVDVPLFIDLHGMAATLKAVSPASIMFCSALANAGYRTSCCHASPLGIKTDAPMNVIWDIMRCWVKQHPVKPQPADSPAYVILSKEPELQADFSRATKAQRKLPAKRFLPNPEENWGPKARAGRKEKKQRQESPKKQRQESPKKQRQDSPPKNNV